MSIHQSMMNNPLEKKTTPSLLQSVENLSMNGEEDKSEFGNSSRHSTPGLLMMSLVNGSLRNYFIYLTESGQIQISDFSHKFKKKYWSGCNSLMLESCPGSIDELMITNPATNQQLCLPPFILPSPASSAIAYVATRMEYKVIRTYSPPHNVPFFGPHRLNCAILTVGVDNTWRLVDTQHLSLDSCQQLKLCPLVTEGFAHWIQDWDPISNGFVLTLNMESETMTRYTVPRCIGRYLYYKYFSTGESNLSLLIARGHFQFNVWEMNSETGVWTKLFNIDLGAHEVLFNESYDREEDDGWFKPDQDYGCRLYPTGWLKYPEVVVFDINMLTRDSFFHTTSIVIYNVQTQDVTVLRLDHKTLPPYLFHRDNQLIVHEMQD